MIEDLIERLTRLEAVQDDVRKHAEEDRARIAEVHSQLCVIMRLLDQGRGAVRLFLWIAGAAGGLMAMISAAAPVVDRWFGHG